MKTSTIKIGSVWKNIRSDGTHFYSGSIDTPCPVLINKDNRIMVFKNESTAENSPVMDIVIIEGNKPQNDETTTQEVDSGSFDVPF